MKHEKHATLEEKLRLSLIQATLREARKDQSRILKRIRQRAFRAKGENA